jgi:phosphoadenosine phosphosulfate reductase
VSTLAASRDDFRTLSDEMEGRTAEEVLAWAAERFAGRIVLTCSWQMQSSVLVHMLHRTGAEVRIVELDTGLLFPETYETRDRLIARYDLDVERIDPARTVAQQEAAEGAELWRRDPDRCCALRKVEPLNRALEGREAWVTGMRREDAPTRTDIGVVGWDDTRRMAKVNPLAGWAQDDVDRYVKEHDVFLNPLRAEGYASIGCAPCTRPVAEGEDARAGRWTGKNKTECGLHT